MNLEKRKQQKEEDKAFRDELEARQEELEKLTFESREITLNVVEEGTPMEDLMTNNEVEASPDNPNAENEDVADDDESRLDIHLQESLRILTDWIITKDASIADTASVQTTPSGFRKLTDPAIAGRSNSAATEPNP